MNAQYEQGIGRIFIWNNEKSYRHRVKRHFYGIQLLNQGIRIAHPLFMKRLQLFALIHVSTLIGFNMQQKSHPS